MTNEESKVSRLWTSNCAGPTTGVVDSIDLEHVGFLQLRKRYPIYTLEITLY